MYGRSESVRKRSSNASKLVSKTVAAQKPPASIVMVEKGKLSAMVSLYGTLTYRARSGGSPYSAFNQAVGTHTELPNDGDKVDCGDVFSKYLRVGTGQRARTDAA